MKKIYLCGPTVYDSPHIGNMKPIVTFDLFFRGLRHLKIDYLFFHNITDIDDKIIAKAIKENKTEKEISQKYTKEYLSLLKKFQILKPNKIFKVTNNIKGITNYIKKLQDLNYAYEYKDSIWFDINKIKEYSEVSNQNISKLISKQINNKESSTFDFALWKKTNHGLQYSYFGKLGRPGWHTECAYFISKIGNLDIHGGGVDLIFPHHENENAQHRAIYKQKICKKFIHIGNLNWNSQKMSKSLGNLILAKEFDSNVFRLIVLSNNIKKPVSLDSKKILDFQNKIRKLENSFYKSFFENQKLKSKKNNDLNKIASYLKNFKFNLIIVLLNKILNKVNKNQYSFNNYEKVLNLLGIKFKLPKSYQIKMYEKWVMLKNLKKWKQSDKLRIKLKKWNFI